jgi:hypothetical protein
MSSAVTGVLASPLWNSIASANTAASPGGFIAEALSAPGASPADVGAAALPMRTSQDPALATGLQEALAKGGFATPAARIRKIARLFGEDLSRPSGSIDEQKSFLDAFFVNSEARGATVAQIPASAVSAEAANDRVAATDPFGGRVRRELQSLLPRMIGGRGGEAPALKLSVEPQSFPRLYSHYLAVPIPYTKIPVLVPVFAGGAMTSGLPSALLFSAIWAVALLLPPTMTMAGKWFAWRAAAVGSHSLGKIFVDPDLNDTDFAGTLAHELAHELRRRGVFKNDLTANGFKTLSVAERIGAEGLPGSLGSAQAYFFDQGASAMARRLQNNSGEDLDRYNFEYSRMFGRIWSLLYRLLPEPPWTYFYGTFMGGAAHELALRTGRAEDSWKFLRLVSEGFSLDAAARAVLGGGDPGAARVKSITRG